MKVVAFVPIKLNSERLPQKNIKPFTNGRPLIQYILETLLQVENIDETYVYCSSNDILSYLPPQIHFLQRETYLDLSTTPFNEVLTTFAQRVDADIYVLTHATAPFISKSSIELGIKKVADGGYDSALTVTKMQEFLWKDGRPYNYEVTNIPRTQDLPPLYTETCGLYVYRKELMIKEKRRIGNNPYLIEVPKIEAIDINEPEDFILADAIYNAQIKK